MDTTTEDAVHDQVLALFRVALDRHGDDGAADAATVAALLRDPRAAREVVRYGLEAEAYGEYVVSDEAVEGAMADRERAREMAGLAVALITIGERADDRRDARRDLLSALLRRVAAGDLDTDGLEAEWRRLCAVEACGEPEPGEFRSAAGELVRDAAAVVAANEAVLARETGVKPRRGQSVTGRAWRARLRRIEARRAWLARNRPALDRLASQLRAAGLLPQA